jgi:tetratricopeptide (TPR) repeat protein
MSTGSFDLASRRGVPLDTLRRALAAHAAGRLSEAKFCCKLVLAANKKQFDALHLLGVIEFQQGHTDEAYGLIRQALKINPRSVHAHCNLGLVLEQLERLDEALASLDKALSIESDNLLALNNRGHILWRLKRPQEALISLDRALAIKPEYADALCNRGNALVDLQRLDEALTSYDRALSINPNDAPTLNNRGNVLWALNRRDEALQSYERALAVNPDDLATLKDRGAALLYTGHGEEALKCFDRALAIKPDDRYFVFKRGSALLSLYRYEEALVCFDHAFAGTPEEADVLDDRANALAALHRQAEAIANYDQALRIDPDSAKAHWNRALALLRVGDFAEGWEEYEWRWKFDALGLRKRNLAPQLRWRGEQPIDGKKILLYGEQGFGDAIQFARYVPLVAELGAVVILEVRSALKNLFAGIKGADFVIGEGEELPAFDLHCPLLSLPLAFKTRLETVPANVPYVFAPDERVRAWKERLPDIRMPRIGLCWAGNQDFRADKPRSIGLTPLLPLLGVPGVQFISLQKDLRPGDEDLLRQHPHVVHLGDQLEDFTDTAAVMSLLDLLISSDTAPVHLAGALGRPVWIMLQYSPDWRWLLDREDNPWYPTARLFRQPTASDWDTVVRQVAAALQAQNFRT